MTIAQGDRLPEATFLQMGPDGPQQIALADIAKGRKIVIFAVPGAFTPTCHNSHVPGFISVMDDLAAKGIDGVYCISVNDPFVMREWGNVTGGAEAGIVFLSDADGSFAKAMGQSFDAPGAGFFGRSVRYALVADDGVVEILNVEESRGAVHTSGGDKILAAL